jgi:hypothetical protein
VLADIDLDHVDSECQRMFEAFQAVFEAFSGRAAVANDVKTVTKLSHSLILSVVAGS